MGLSSCAVRCYHLTVDNSPFVVDKILNDEDECQMVTSDTTKNI